MAQTKSFQINVNSTYSYISIFNGLMDLTDMEMKVLAEFVDVYRSLKKADLDINPFSTEMKKKVAKNLGRDDFNTLNNYIKSLADKRAIRKVEGEYVINPILVPTGDDEIIKINITNESE